MYEKTRSQKTFQTITRCEKTLSTLACLARSYGLVHVDSNLALYFVFDVARKM